MAQYIQVSIAVTAAAEAEMLIALLSAAGYEGFEENETGLQAFIPAAVFGQAALEEMLSGRGLAYSLQTIEEQNWNAQWESGFSPVQVGSFAAVRASFHQPVPGVAHEIIITPKMSFGTGHHDTTYMMIEQMQQLDFTAISVLDFGTGTGVLAILAHKMGAREILALDNDTWSISNCTDNVRDNGCTGIGIQLADSLPAGRQFDIILANINLNVITESLPDIAKACRQGSRVLLSGFLEGDEAVLVPLLHGYGFRETGIFSRNNWRCIAAVLN